MAFKEKLCKIYQITDKIRVVHYYGIHCIANAVLFNPQNGHGREWKFVGYVRFPEDLTNINCDYSTLYARYRVSKGIPTWLNNIIAQGDGKVSPLPMYNSIKKVTWIEFFPVTGKIVPMIDRKILGDTLLLAGRYKTYRKNFPSKEAALNYLNTIRGKLSKNYKCLLSTDKQFGMASEEDGYSIPYTKKQLQEAYYV